MKPLIALDLTGVLENPWPAKRRWFLKVAGIDFGETPRARSQILQLVDERKDLYSRMIEEVYSDAEIPKHPPIDGAPEAIAELSEAFRFSILTSRLPARRAVTETWLERHGFARFIDDLIMLGDPLLLPESDHPPGSKLAWCVLNGAVALADDALRNLVPTEVRVAGAETVVKYLCGPHKRRKPAPDGVRRVRNWQELADDLRSRFISASAQGKMSPSDTVTPRQKGKV